jgi:RNA polymerase sigma-70 factor (ECF subfamily)
MKQHQQQQEVADGLRQGNQQAWRMFYDAHAERVWRLVTRQMSTSCDVADVVQETFLAGAKSAAKYDPSRGTLWNWISGIARNQVALHYRKQQRQQPLKQSDDGSSGNREAVIDWLESREASPPEALASVELVSLIRTTLTELPIDYEELLTAKYIEGASVQQIAIAEDCGQESIRSKLARARRAFRRAFTQSSTYSTVERGEHDES